MIIDLTQDSYLNRNSERTMPNIVNNSFVSPKSLIKYHSFKRNVFDRLFSSIYDKYKMCDKCRVVLNNVNTLYDYTSIKGDAEGVFCRKCDDNEIIINKINSISSILNAKLISSRINTELLQVRNLVDV